MAEEGAEQNASGSAHPAGTLYADLGKLDEAFGWWENAISKRNVEAAYLLAATRDPDLQGIGSDPRFMALVEKMKLLK